MNPTAKTVDSYVKEVVSRFEALSPEETKGVMDLYGTPQLMTISKILGPEISTVLGQAMNALVMESTRQTTPIEQPQPMAKGGLVSRRKKSVAKKK